MVNQNQIEHVRALVETTQSLSAEERQEWLSLLPFMSDKQLLELSTVLESHPAVEKSAEPKTVTVKNVRKALPRPPEELDLPAPHPAPARPVSPKAPLLSPSAQQAQQNSVSAFINRNFGATMHRGQGPVADIIPPAPPRSGAAAPTVTPQTAPVPVSAPTPEEAKAVAAPVPVKLPFQGTPAPVPAASTPPVWEEVVVRLKSLEDVRRLTVATLRAKGTEFLETGLKELGNKYGYFSVQLALEQSPLYQTYLSVGARVLRDHANFEALQNELSTSGRPYLAKAEFEEMSDLLQRIKGG